MDKILEVKNISYSYDNDKNIFSDLSFSLNKGEIFSILGVNGAGKSTLLNCLTNLEKIKSGEIKINGKNIYNMSRNEFSKIVGYVPQIHVATYSYEVLDFILMGRSPHIGIFNSPKKKDYEIAIEVINKLNLTHLIDKKITALSGGEFQQVLIARVLVQQPQIIILDEPTNHLDYGNQIRVLRMIKSLAKEGYSIIFTTHTPEHALMLNEKSGILSKNGKFIIGNTCDILTENNLKDIYKIDLYLFYEKKFNRKLCVPEF